jgi:hypothetical protein
VRSAGFEPVRVTSFVSILLPLMFASRLRHRQLNEDYDPVSEFQINPLLNSCLHAIMSVERLLIRFASVPVGGSLLVAAVRRY